MKCEQCGNPNITLEDEFCPYCGALNEAARKHIEDMKHFSGRFEETQSQVMENVTSMSKFHSEIIVVVILALLNITVLVCNINKYEISWWLEDRAVKANASSYEKLMSELEANGDYILLSRYFNSKSLYAASDDLKEYSTLANLAYDYDNIISNIYYLNNDGISYHSQDEIIEEIADSVTNFYSEFSCKDKEYYIERGDFKESHLNAMNNMEKNIKICLKGHCNLTDEDIDELEIMSKQQLRILLGRRTGIYE